MGGISGQEPTSATDKTLRQLLGSFLAGGAEEGEGDTSQQGKRRAQRQPLLSRGADGQAGIL